jgi:carbamoyltransferase
MKICGLKLTHDGSIALIDNDQLIFCIEFEKLNNNPRYEMIEDTDKIEAIIKNQGYTLPDIDYFVIDGWGGYNKEELAIQPRLRIGEKFNYLSARNETIGYELKVAQYQEKYPGDDIVKGLEFEGLRINNHRLPYTSYLHAAGHILSAYCTSPFAEMKQDSFVLVWDGGMFPNLYFVDQNNKKITSHGPLFLLVGNIYTIFSQHFDPFKANGNFAKDSLSIAGKVMAYVAKGTCREELFSIFESVLDIGFDNSMGYANFFARNVKQLIEKKKMNFPDEDILRSFHEFMATLLVEKLSKKIARLSIPNANLCIAGGCALNIKWNSAIRNSGLFKAVFVPPFPNDSGSAIGAACAKRYELTGELALKWNVYSGPNVIKNVPYEGWKSRLCNLKELANILHETGEPIVFLNGKAELGPRALGNRSILATANFFSIKEIMNQIKKREYYRPISPICMEEHAKDLFIPGTSDPYMLYDHLVNENWAKSIPGIIHLDNTARLQTVTKVQNPVVYELLNEYYKLSGIPLLCNTSANYNGSGFFPDVNSATKWNNTNYVWCENELFFKSL